MTSEARARTTPSQTNHPQPHPTQAQTHEIVQVLTAPSASVVLRALGANATLDLPLVGFRAPAGFPSPAADFEVERLDLFERLELDQPYVFLARVAGESMTGGDDRQSTHLQAATSTKW